MVHSPHLVGGLSLYFSGCPSATYRPVAASPRFRSGTVFPWFTSFCRIWRRGSAKQVRFLVEMRWYFHAWLTNLYVTNQNQEASQKRMFLKRPSCPQDNQSHHSSAWWIVQEPQTKQPHNAEPFQALFPPRPPQFRVSSTIFLYIPLDQGSDCLLTLM